MKICHIITRMIVGGAQENTLLTIAGHVIHGHEVTLVTGLSPGPEGELLKRQDFPDFEIVENRHLVRNINPLSDILAFLSLKKFFMTRSFDVVHTHSSKAGIIGRAAAAAADVPFITHTVHGQAFHQYEKNWKNYIYIASERWAAKRAHKIFAVCQAMIDQCVEAKVATPEKYKVVYSGMELEPFLNSEPDNELRKDLGIPEDAQVVGAVARLFPLKGYEYFVPMAAKVVDTLPTTRFLVVGDGIMMDNLKHQIASLGIEKNFIFTGLIPPNQIYKYTALMNILVHLSLREGLPRAVVQALASAKPAVGFALDGTPEVILDGKTGFLAVPESVESAVEGVVKLLKDPKKAAEMGAEGRRLVTGRFDWKKMADTLEKEYIDGLKQRNTST